MISKGFFYKFAAYLLIVLAFSNFSLANKIIYVDDDGTADFNNIQAAIDYANDGDTVVVSDGIYTGRGNYNIEFKGKAIMVKSQNGPDTCIIDCWGNMNSSHMAFYFHYKEDANSLVQGFTIMNGINNIGIYCYDANPIITKCIFTANGCGINCFKSSPVITECLLIANDNGVNCSQSNSVISNCIIAGNKHKGITCDSSNPIITNCSIMNNSVGIEILSNTYTYPYVPSTPTLINCLITGNYTDSYGGGIYCSGSSFNLINCTLSGNKAKRQGGAISIFSGRDVNINNCIIYENTALTGSDIFISYPVRRVTASQYPLYKITNSVIGSEPNTIEGDTFVLTGHWIHANPLFAKPGYWADTNDPNIIAEPNDTDAIWIEGDYHLKSQAGRFDPNTQCWVQDDVTSPCIDAGDPNSPIGLEQFPNGGRINMGAYGGTTEASKSYFGKPVCTTVVAGDINGDCKVDVLDFEIMLLHWLEEH
jgi:hypothetical protein